MNTNLEDAILRAIDIIASRKIASAGYDKTVQATIVSCVDATIGKYKVKYQDSFLYAFSSSIDTSFPVGTNVFILIPNGDMNKDKTILGTTKKLGVNYVTVAEGDQKYTPIGNNVIDETGTFNLCSYEEGVKVLYSKENNPGLISLNAAAIKEYLTKSSCLTLGMQVQTKLPLEQQYQGNYGIIVGLDFKDNSTGDEITRYFSVDVDTMQGNPYRLANKTRQYGIFEIDGANFLRVDSISLFVKNFPEQQQEKPYDIFISDIEMCGAGMLSQQDLNSCALVLMTPKGYIFNDGNAETDTKTIEAQLRVKGKVVDLQSQSVPFYWFIENIGINSRSQKYNKYGGQGWECLNTYTQIKAATSTTPAIIDFIPSKNILTLKKSDVQAKQVKYKCVVIYDGTVLTKQIAVINESAVYNIFIESDKGTQFYYDTGNPTLTCKCQQKNSSGSYVDIPIDNLRFIWSRVNNFGTFETLPDTDEYNTDQNRLQTLFNSIQSYLTQEFILAQQNFDASRLLPTDATINAITNTTRKNAVSTARTNLINSGLTSTTLIQQLLNKYNIVYSGTSYQNVIGPLQNSISTYAKTQRIKNNQIIGLSIKDITNFATFKCSVYTKSGNIFLGTDSITIINSLKGESLYSLVINNGSQVFKYNSQGVSPCSKQNAIPYVIPALTFTVFDNLGNPIDDDVIKHSSITWTVPTSNTMLKVSGNYSGYPDSTGTKMIYDSGLMSFSYGIEDRFNVSKTENNIQLKVNYKGLNLVAKTDLTFTKEGAAGTNGTDFVCKIVPNVTSGATPLYPTIVYNGSTATPNYTTNGSYWFKAQLWHNGQSPIYSGTQSGNSSEGKLVTIIKWEVLKNTYTSTLSDRTNFSINATNGSCSFSAGNLSGAWNESNYRAWRAANIIKVTLSYDGYTYYGTLPVIVVRSFNSNYRVNLKQNTGFREVLYSSSGVNPSFDNHAPFELTVETLINNRWQDISNNAYDYKMNYAWYYMGSVYYRTSGTSWTETIESNSTKYWLMDRTMTSLKSNQKSVKPADNYDGQCVNVAVACRVYNASGTTLAWIHIPIHLLRNRFQNSAINGWDGNSVDLGNGTGTILAPQVGAGVKDSNNRFTGVVIGTSRNPEANTSAVYNTGNTSQGVFANAGQDVGLFGYHEGSRSIFLDAKTGKAVFGQTGQAQIVLDPSTTGSGGRKSAKIQSGNYSTTNKTGMLIDLTTPEMKFGSGNFIVNSSGHITAKGGGSIAGWTIDDNALTKNNTGMNSNPTVNQTGSRTVSINVPGNQTYSGVNKAIAFWAGNRNFEVSHDGYLRTQVASIGSGSTPIFIGGSGSNSAIFSGTKTSKNASKSGFYIGVDGLGIGTSSAIAGTSTVVSDFQVESDGTMYARKGYIGNGRNGWLIQSTSLQNNKSSLNDLTYDRGVYIGVEGISLGRINDSTPAFKVDNSGTLTAQKGNIGNWTVTTNSIYSGTDSFTATTGMYFGTGGLRLGSRFSVDPNGNLKAENGVFQGKIVSTQGQIADWTIGPGRIYQYGNYDNVYISANAGIKLRNFSVDSTGHLTVGSTSGGLFSVNNNNGTINLQTPYGAVFQVNAANGTLSLKNSSGNSFQVNANGRMSLNGAGNQHFEVNTATGKMGVGDGEPFSVDAISGKLEIKTKTGGSFVVDPTSGTMSLGTSWSQNKFTVSLSTGQISVGKFKVNDTGTLQVGSSAGGMFSVNAADGTMSLSTSAGGNNFTVDRSGNVTCLGEFKQSGGKVDIKGPATADNLDIKSGSMARGTLGGGGGSVSHLGGSLSSGLKVDNYATMTEWGVDLIVNRITANYIQTKIGEITGQLKIGAGGLRVQGGTVLDGFLRPNGGISFGSEFGQDGRLNLYKIKVTKGIITNLETVKFDDLPDIPANEIKSALGFNNNETPTHWMKRLLIGGNDYEGKTVATTTDLNSYVKTTTYNSHKHSYTAPDEGGTPSSTGTPS